MTDVVLGLLRTGDLDLALPLRALREAVPCPERLAPAPAPAPGLLGLLPLRGRVLPVVDLAVALGGAHAAAPGQVVVVVRDDDRLVGVLVDEVRGMARVPADRLDAVDAGALVSHLWEGPATGGVVSVLEAAGLLRLPGLPVVVDAVHEQADAAAPRAGGRTLVLTRCGPFVLGVDVALVHSTVPSPPLSPSPADGPTCLGTTPFAGSAVAVVDVLALLGVGRLDGAHGLGCGVVLDLPDGQVVLGASAVVGLHEVPHGSVAPLPPLTSPAPGLLTGVADVDGVGPALLLDLPALRALPDVVALSRLAVPLDERAGVDDAARRAAVTGVPHLAYDVGSPVCTDLAQVTEVLGRPEALLPAGAAPGVLGLVVHRGRPVPVVDLADAVGRPPLGVEGAERLLLVEVDGEPVAYAVAGLRAILPRTWEDEAQPPTGSTPLHRARLVQLAGSDALVPSLDLHALTRELRGAPALPAPRAELLPA